MSALDVLRRFADVAANEEIEDPREMMAWIRSKQTPEAQRLFSRPSASYEIVPDALFGVVENAAALEREMLEAEADYAEYLEE